MSPKLIRRLLAGVDLKVGLDYDTHMYLKKLSAVSGRHLWQIGNSALSAYLKDPDSFRHCIVDASPDAHVVMNTSLERADFFTREAAASPVTARSRFIGRVVREFIRRETFEEMAEWFYSYSDVLEVVARNQIGEGPEADETPAAVKRPRQNAKQRDVTASKPPRGCSARTKSGAQCKMPPLHGSDFCFAHSKDKTTRAKAKEARTNGGRLSSRRKEIAQDEIPEQVRTIDDCLRFLEVTARALALNRVEPKRGNAIVIAVSAIHKLLADHDLERRLKRLEDGQHER
jgi:hypothetical protein